MLIYEKELNIPVVSGHQNLISHFAQKVDALLPKDEIPVRFAVTATDSNRYRCEIGMMSGMDKLPFERPESIFEFRKRKIENTDNFNVVLLVPTGIGSEIGGHAGDAGQRQLRRPRCLGPYRRRSSCCSHDQPIRGAGAGGPSQADGH